MLGYRLYRDLERGWRITAPNLEQAAARDRLRVARRGLRGRGRLGRHATRRSRPRRPERREQIARSRSSTTCAASSRSRSTTSTRDWQEALKQRSSQRLIEPWALDEDEQLDARTRRSSRSRAARGARVPRRRLRLGARRLRPVPAPARTALGIGCSLEDTDDGHRRPARGAPQSAGLVAVVAEPADDGGRSRLPARGLGDALAARATGRTPYHDPIRVPHAPEDGGTHEPVLRRLLPRASRPAGRGSRRASTPPRCRPTSARSARSASATGELPVLFCSPTMELGVDIAELNVVNMRNVPPTPANYAQRRGRAGRSGQPALVFTYCSAGNSHDQYFFRRPDADGLGPGRRRRGSTSRTRTSSAPTSTRSGSPRPGVGLGSSLADVLDARRRRADARRSRRVVARAARRPGVASARATARRARPRDASPDDSSEADWYARRAGSTRRSTQRRPRFDDACDRWRELYRAALDDARDPERRSSTDASRAAARNERGRAPARARPRRSSSCSRGEADRELVQSDFYSYRYFASEGFLPGYSFPRLPLSAFIPGRARPQGTRRVPVSARASSRSPSSGRAASSTTRARATSSTGSSSRPSATEENRLPTERVKLCASCGYLHPIEAGEPGPDLCERCGAPLDAAADRALPPPERRDQAPRPDQLRRGGAPAPGLRGPDRRPLRRARRPRPARRRTSSSDGDDAGARSTYGSAATLWRINLGWTRRKNKEQLGFVLDTERGYWATNDAGGADDPDDPMSRRQQRVIPYVEDRRNCAAPRARRGRSTPSVMASLAGRAQERDPGRRSSSRTPSSPPSRCPTATSAACSSSTRPPRAAPACCAGSPTIPTRSPRVAREALELCHFDPETGEDRGTRPGAREDCEAACYDCLLSYANQRDHRCSTATRSATCSCSSPDATVEVAPGALAARRPPRAAPRALRLRARAALPRLPRRAAVSSSRRTRRCSIERLRAQPDFAYASHHVVVFVDGPHHDYADVEERDGQATSRLEDDGYTVIRFRHDERLGADRPALPERLRPAEERRT